MWLFYLMTLISASVGTGAYVAYESEVAAQSAIREQAPATHAAVSADAIRALRRLRQINPASFPQPTGNRKSVINSQLLAQVLVGGRSLPIDVVFEIDSTGTIHARITSDSETGGINAEHYQHQVANSGASGPSIDMDIKARNLNLLVNRDAYVFEQTPNYEHLAVGVQL